MVKKKNKPEIRFNGFVEDWEDKELGEVVNLENGYAFKGEYFQDEPTDIIVLTPGNVHIGGGFQKGKGRYYNISGVFPNRFILKPSEIFVTMTDLTPSAQTLGFPAVVPDDGNTYLHNQRLGKLTNFEGDKRFLLQLLRTEKNHKQIVLTASGTTVKHSSPEKILNCLNYFPNTKEQSKIGNYFQNLDKLITLRQQKYEKLLILKKAMLSKMFPKEGASVPEIRFSGFTEDWEKKMLNEICTYHTSSLSVGNALTNGRYDLYDANSVIGFTNSNIQTCDYITIIKDGSGVGRVRLLPKNTSFIGTMGAFQTNGSNINFLFCCLTKTNFNKHITGATIPHVYFSNYGNDYYYVPNINEQTKIGEYFSKFDNLISLNQQELKKLKSIKKAFLEKMFV